MDSADCLSSPLVVKRGWCSTAYDRASDHHEKLLCDDDRFKTSFVFFFLPWRSFFPGHFCNREFSFQPNQNSGNGAKTIPIFK